MRNIFAAASVALALSATGSLAATFDGLVDFSEFNNNDIITQIDLGGGVMVAVEVVNGPSAVGEARVFDTTEAGGPAVNQSNDPDLVSDAFSNSDGSEDTLSFGNALIIQERENLAAGNGGPDDERRGGVIFFDFGTASVNLLNLYYLDGEEGFSVEANMAEIGSGMGSDDEFTFVNFEANDDARGISRFAVVFDGSGAIGEFEVELSAVPLPAGVPLLLSGLAAFGVMRRRRKAA